MSTDRPFGGGSGPRNSQPDFFASPTSYPAAQPTSATSPQPFAPGPFAPQPFGTPPASPAAYPPMPYQPLAPRRSGMPGWAIAAICIPLAVVMVLVLAAVAIPVFLNQRAKAAVANTSVSLPPIVAGLAEVADPELQAQFAADFEAMAECSCFERPVMRLYSDEDRSHVVVVVAAKFTRPARAEDQRRISDELWRGLRDGARGSAVFARAVAGDPGRLGGMVTCAPVSSPAVPGRACVAVDTASFVTLFEVDSAPLTDAALPTTVREAVVHRT